MRKIHGLVLSVCGLLTTVSLAGNSAEASESGREPTPVSAGVADSDQVGTLAGVQRGCGGLPNGGTISLRSASNDRYVAAEVEYEGGSNGLLRARSGDNAGSWEHYRLRHQGGTVWALQNVNNGRYVTVEREASGENANALRARAGTVEGSWQEFELQCYQGTATWMLYALTNDRYVSVEREFTGYNANALRARSASVGGSWEQFNLYLH
ncbi:hypothetical protein E1265_29730 [Streptomyces sp. 8K308]|uniref:fascin domain-containing protein n=1 Tax=Streptomyces sp. 8K308 TaxID=2530388 RepID=UPI00104C94CB|nr:hypothetical protein [Streptomyces sp. 8K308]TDC12513.1 hypothetical protein E1265_29730 [Streptomyces sp. 8K308]